MKQGYMLTITSWENDGDNYRDKVIYGLSLVDAQLIVEFCEIFRRFGNEFLEDSDFEEISELVKESVAKKPKASLELKEEFLRLDDMYDFINDVVSKYLCNPVEYYEENFVRAYDGHKLHYVPKEIYKCSIDTGYKVS